MASLMDKIIKTANSPFASKLSESTVISKADQFSPFDPYILNLSFSGKFDGGISSGITVLSAPPKHLKTIILLEALAAWQKEHSDGIAIIYDSEYGITTEYLEKHGIDQTRVVHIPFRNLEELRTGMTNQIEELYGEFEADAKSKKSLKNVEKPEIFIGIDSIGQSASLKEINDAKDDKQAADFTRAKVITSLMRIITPTINLMDMTCVILNQTYKSMEMYGPKNIAKGGEGLKYAADSGLTISKAQIKGKDGELEGYKFTITATESRFIKEKTMLPLYIFFDRGIPKYSGMFDLAKAMGILEPCRVGRKGGWKFTLDGVEGEEPQEFKCLTDEIHDNEEFWEAIFEHTDFKEVVENHYAINKTISVDKSNPLEEFVAEEETKEPKKTKKA